MLKAHLLQHCEGDGEATLCFDKVNYLKYKYRSGLAVAHGPQGPPGKSATLWSWRLGKQCSGEMVLL